MTAVALISGGMDSAIMLYYLAARLGYTEIYAVTVLYGQKHDRELECAEWQCRQVSAVKEWKVVDLGVLGELTETASALTGADIEIPTLADIPESQRNQPPTYVPNRNMTMLSLAVAYAESRDCSHVFYGAQAQDEYGYWDCTAEFVSRLNHVLSLNRNVPVIVEAPFAALRKAEELKLGVELGVDFSRTWTCYRGGVLACGDCPSCSDRLAAFAEAGMEDPLEYSGEDSS